MSFYIVQAMQGMTPEQLFSPAAALEGIALASETPPQTSPDKPKGQYSVDRRFRAALKGLRFKSGMRFDLENEFDEQTGAMRWRVAFFFGNSKAIQELRLDDTAAASILGSAEIANAKKPISLVLSNLEKWLNFVDPALMQSVWARKASAPDQHPHHVADALAKDARAIAMCLDQIDDLIPVLERVFTAQIQSATVGMVGWSKVAKNATQVLAGILVAASANKVLCRSVIRKAA
jgi:DNA (cytosine-5)-methyltransferase 1